MLYICIPTHDEAPTVGVLLWRIRKVFQEYSREYEILVYDDASTDATIETLEPYRKVLPLTVLSGKSRQGYAGAVAALLAEAATRTRYPRRDAVILMQADFTDQPEHLPELVRRFEGGADVVVAEADPAAAAPADVRKRQQLSRWLLWPVQRAFRLPGVRDPFGTLRLMRVTVVRDMLRAAGEAGITRAPEVAVANFELLRAAAAAARRIEAVPLASRWDVRPRASRVEPWPWVKAVFRAGWAWRRRPLPSSAA